MAPSVRTSASQRARLRGVLAVVVLAGYLAALGGTSAGQGWRLLNHLGEAHAGASRAAPELVAEGTAVLLPVIPTLRSPAAHRHGPSHHHGLPDEAHEPPLPVGAVRVVHVHDEPPALGGPFHRHGDLVHSHDAPGPERPVVVHVSIDTHRMPEPARLPAPPPPRNAPVVVFETAPRSVDGSVETPPPLGHG